LVSNTFQVTVNNVVPNLTVAPDQATKEGDLLSIPDIGKFTEPVIGSSQHFTYSIDWGDGIAPDTGTATIDIPGVPGETRTSGSFDGAHSYADNGVYTVTVKVDDGIGGISMATFTVTVANVAPTLTVAPNQTVDKGALLTISNIGHFQDPGFDNPLNIGGE